MSYFLRRFVCKHGRPCDQNNIIVLTFLHRQLSAQNLIRKKNKLVYMINDENRFLHILLKKSLKTITRLHKKLLLKFIQPITQVIIMNLLLQFNSLCTKVKLQMYIYSVPNLLTFPFGFVVVG